MKKVFLLLLCSAVLISVGSGCATGFRSVDYAKHVQTYSVDGHVVEKMDARLPLELVEIVHLTEQEVPDSLIIGYIKQEETIYQLTSDHVTMLSEQGVSKDVIDFLLTTPAAHVVRPQPILFNYPVPPYPYHRGFGGFYGPGFFCY